MGDWNWNPQPRRAPAERSAEQNAHQHPERDQDADRVDETMGTRACGVLRVPELTSARPLRKSTGKTHGIRLRMMPPRKARRTMRRRPGVAGLAGLAEPAGPGVVAVLELPAVARNARAVRLEGLASRRCHRRGRWRAPSTPRSSVGDWREVCVLLQIEGEALWPLASVSAARGCRGCSGRRERTRPGFRAGR